MTKLARQAQAEPIEFVLQWLQHWLSPYIVNGFPVPARPRVQELVIQPWLDASGGSQLDLSKAPFRLLAIVNRIDLRQPGDAGEARFIFGGVNLGQCEPTRFGVLGFTMILEYRLDGEGTRWANDWHGLSQFALGSEEYNSALEVLTERFSDGTLRQVRTNEGAFSGGVIYELREFTPQLQITTLTQSPDHSFNTNPPQQRELASFINENEPDILDGRHIVPPAMLGGEVSNAITFWNPPGVSNPDARHLFALATCNGCHSLQAETGTTFFHVFNRSPLHASSLSDFLTGTTVADPVSGVPRTFNDIARRKADMESLLNGGGGFPASPNRAH